MMSKSHYEIPNELYYSKEHEWLRVNDKQAVVGITDYAQKQLHEVVYVETPKIGTILTQFQTIGTVESVKSVSDIFSPISGKIFEVNKELSETPELLNQDPYEKGWIVKISPANLEEDLSKLLKAQEYAKYLKSLEE